MPMLPFEYVREGWPERANRLLADGEPPGAGHVISENNGPMFPEVDIWRFLQGQSPENTRASYVTLGPRSPARHRRTLNGPTVPCSSSDPAQAFDRSGVQMR